LNAIDTNVLLRYVLDDDAQQSRRARRLIDRIRVLVTDVALCEALWVLAGKRYGLKKEEIVGVMYALLGEPHITFENSSVVWRALVDFEESAISFQDALILYKARSLQFASLSDLTLWTFDRKLPQHPRARAP